MQALARTGRAVLARPARTRAMGLNKSKYIEEWSNRRETSEAAFALSLGTGKAKKKVPWLLFTVGVIPAAVYMTSKNEQFKQDAKAGVKREYL